mmetsp:Transcript_22886/g.48689  ORF Transcript_22886/g.48689 Transcript_22886/m.48689 type:complete len:333 (+) Transcript_22886:170-1168(+)|eukprot:CAMPEP_0201129804 /NCGR_PEP_ID=MMETSP0850-20130426/38032_1 /ASSEMBLY_ACC=CAM_ASM_000622 /TAXON_ID=183588 /ORGANISM="Pseudo-nitzschia fraudulenta, Strain WWA7" /LENGTH=332 /DNA_ID=CAMNT_0047399385 /DNA_START=41 /DNA_END=1039 /DNA_ORIENTATION=-
MIDDSKNSSQLALGDNEPRRSGGIPIDILVWNSDATEIRGQIESHGSDCSSIGDTSISLEYETDDDVTKYFLNDMVESTYQDLEGIHENEKNENHQAKNFTADLISTSSSLLDTLVPNNLLHRKWNVLKGSGSIIGNGSESQGDDSSFRSNFPFNHECYVQGSAGSTSPTASLSDTAHLRKVRRKKRHPINFRTKVERLQHQMTKPFRSVHKLLVWTAERLSDSIYERPDSCLQFATNHYTLKGDNESLPLSETKESIELPIRMQPIPNIVSFDSSDLESYGGFRKGLQNPGNDDDSSAFSRNILVPSVNNMKDGTEDLRWLYARQLLPVEF